MQEEGKDDPVVAILKKLGPAPPQVDKAKDRTVALQLADRRSQRISSACPRLTVVFLIACLLP